MDLQVDGRPSQTGVVINNDTAMAYSAVFNAVQVIAGSLASIPFVLYNRIDELAREPAINHPLYSVLRNQPNGEMDSFTWRETSMNHLLMKGNSYSEIKRDTMGRVIELWPMNPDRTKVTRNDNKRIIYELDEGPGKKRTLRADQVLHIPGLGFDGRVGYSVLSLARETMGLGLGMETFQSRFYGAGTNLGSVFEHPARLSEQSQKNLKKSLTEKYAGLGNSQQAIILEEGMKYIKVGMPLNDAQFLESRTFQVLEIARWFNLPPHKLMELTHATFSNIEEMQIQFVQDTMRVWFVRWEQAVLTQLLDEGERRRLFAEFMIDALLRGDIVSRNTALSTQRMNGVISANEWRQKVNMNPIDGRAGDLLWQPLNMTDANEPDTIMGSTEPGEPTDEDENNDEDNSRVEFERRVKRTIQSRRLVARSYKPLFARAVKRILAEEIKNIRRIAKKTLTQRDAGDFIFELNEFYKTFRQKIFKEFSAVYHDFGPAIYPLAADEVNAPLETPAEFTAYITEFVDHTTNRYIGSSAGQLTKIVREAEDFIADIEARLAKWEETRAAQVADREVIDGETGFAQWVYFAGGFTTVWVAIGKSCPYCNSLDGRVISRGGTFLSKGQSFQPEGAETPLVVSANVSHPAAHGKCDCTVRAGI